MTLCFKLFYKPGHCILFTYINLLSKVLSFYSYEDMEALIQGHNSASHQKPVNSKFVEYQLNATITSSMSVPPTFQMSKRNQFHIFRTRSLMPFPMSFPNVAIFRVLFESNLVSKAFFPEGLLSSWIFLLSKLLSNLKSVSQSIPAIELISK